MKGNDTYGEPVPESSTGAGGYLPAGGIPGLRAGPAASASHQAAAAYCANRSPDNACRKCHRIAIGISER